MADTLFLRALAALLIVNSHLEAFYPRPYLAADGLLGDSLFFLLSGFGLVLSARKTARRFPGWYGRRFGRIWPSVALATLWLDFIPGAGWRDWTWSDFIARFGWGDRYPFVREILVLYVAAYPFVRSGRRSVLLGGAVGLLPIYSLGVIWRGSTAYSLLHDVFYFQMMLFGGWLALSPGATRAGGRRALAGLVALLAVYVGVRFAVRAGAVSRMTFLPQAAAVPILWLLVRLARSEWVGRLMDGRPGLAIGAIGAMSLEIYLAHLPLTKIEALAGLRFPVGLALVFGLTPALAWGISRLSKASRGVIPSVGRRATLPAAERTAI